MLRLVPCATFCFLLWLIVPQQILTNCDNIKGPATTQLAFFSQGRGIASPSQISSAPAPTPALTSLRHNVCLGFFWACYNGHEIARPKTMPQQQNQQQQQQYSSSSSSKVAAAAAVSAAAAAARQQQQQQRGPGPDICSSSSSTAKIRVQKAAGILF